MLKLLGFVSNSGSDNLKFQRFTNCFQLQGMVDPGEFVPTTLQREFSEEALNIEHMTVEERNTLNNKLKELFHSGKEVSLSFFFFRNFNSLLCSFYTI